MSRRGCGYQQDNKSDNIYLLSCSAAASENDLDLKFCGTWVHGKGALSLDINLSTGCKGLLISANETYLSIDGQITSQCSRSEVISLKNHQEQQTEFCLYWDPLVDQMKLQVNQKDLTFINDFIFML